MPRTHIFATVEADAVAQPLQQAAAAGKAIFHIRRSDGTLRRMSYLPPGSAHRRLAERIDRAREKGVPMKDIALKQHVSIPTVRRIINNLELSRHIESGDMDYAVELKDRAEPATFQRRRSTDVPIPREAPVEGLVVAV